MNRDVAYYVARHDRRKAHRAQRLRNRHHGSNLWELLYRDVGKHFRAMYATTKEGR